MVSSHQQRPKFIRLDPIQNLKFFYGSYPPFCYKGDLKKSKKEPAAALPAFATGQIWQMEKSRVQIGMIGKTLVHYKHFRAGNVRSPVTLTGRVALEKFLIENSAVLVES